MRLRKVGTICLVIAVVVLLTILAFRVRIGATADAVAVLQTSGMSCGSCSRTITTTLEKLKGVAATEVDVTSGWVIVGYDTKAITPETLAEKVSTAGYASMVTDVLTPQQFKEITGRYVGQDAVPSAGCCGVKGGGCNPFKRS